MAQPATPPHQAAPSPPSSPLATHVERMVRALMHEFEPGEVDVVFVSQDGRQIVFGGSKGMGEMTLRVMRVLFAIQTAVAPDGKPMLDAAYYPRPNADEEAAGWRVAYQRP